MGIHIVDFASFGADSEIVALSCTLKTFAKAEGDRIGDYLLDANDSATINVAFENGALGVIHATRFASGYANRLALQVFGTAGAIRVDLDRSPTELEICEGPDLDTQRWRTIECGQVATNYARFVEAVKGGATMEPSFRRAAELQVVLDGCFESDRTGRRITL